MAGISTKAAGDIHNNYKFNLGTELNNDLGLSWYETLYRGFDAQIGRFHQIDPITDISENWSPYVFVQNNPILYNDPLGLDTAINQSNPKILNEVIVRANISNNQYETTANLLSYTAGLFGAFDMYFGVFYKKYDHKNYITTKGKIKPFPVNIKRASQQAKKAKVNSTSIKTVGFGISLAANLLTFLQIRDQYLNAGKWSAVDPLDVTGLSLGVTGITAEVLEYFRIAPNTLGAISEASGISGLILGTYQLWMSTFKTIYNTNLPTKKYFGDTNTQFDAAMHEQTKGEWKENF